MTSNFCGNCGYNLQKSDTIFDKLIEYEKLEKSIHEYFNYKEDWVTIPIDMHLGDYWMIIGDDPTGLGGHVVYSAVEFTYESIVSGKVVYHGPIYTQRFLPRWIYRGEECTMISVDTQCDGNKYLMIFSNEKECTEKFLKSLYESTWLSESWVRERFYRIKSYE